MERVNKEIEIFSNWAVECSVLLYTLKTNIFLFNFFFIFSRRCMHGGGEGSQSYPVCLLVLARFLRYLEVRKQTNAIYLVSWPWHGSCSGVSCQKLKQRRLSKEQGSNSRASGRELGKKLRKNLRAASWRGGDISQANYPDSLSPLISQKQLPSLPLDIHDHFIPPKLSVHTFCFILLHRKCNR